MFKSTDHPISNNLSGSATADAVAMPIAPCVPLLPSIGLADTKSGFHGLNPRDCVTPPTPEAIAMADSFIRIPSPGTIAKLRKTSRRRKFQDPKVRQQDTKKREDSAQMEMRLASYQLDCKERPPFCSLPSPAYVDNWPHAIRRWELEPGDWVRLGDVKWLRARAAQWPFYYAGYSPTYWASFAGMWVEIIETAGYSTFRVSVPVHSMGKSSSVSDVGGYIPYTFHQDMFVECVPIADLTQTSSDTCIWRAVAASLENSAVDVYCQPGRCDVHKILVRSAAGHSLMHCHTVESPHLDADQAPEGRRVYGAIVASVNLCARGVTAFPFAVGVAIDRKSDYALQLDGLLRGDRRDFCSNWQEEQAMHVFTVGPSDWRDQRTVKVDRLPLSPYTFMTGDTKDGISVGFKEPTSPAGDCASFSCFGYTGLPHVPPNGDLIFCWNGSFSTTLLTSLLTSDNLGPGPVAAKMLSPDDSCFCPPGVLRLTITTRRSWPSAQAALNLSGRALTHAPVYLSRAEANQQLHSGQLRRDRGHAPTRFFGNTETMTIVHSYDAMTRRLGISRTFPEGIAFVGTANEFEEKTVSPFLASIFFPHNVEPGSRKLFRDSDHIDSCCASRTARSPFDGLFTGRLSGDKLDSRSLSHFKVVEIVNRDDYQNVANSICSSGFFRTAISDSGAVNWANVTGTAIYAVYLSDEELSRQSSLLKMRNLNISALDDAMSICYQDLEAHSFPNLHVSGPSLTSRIKRQKTHPDITRLRRMLDPTVGIAARRFERCLARLSHAFRNVFSKCVSVEQEKAALHVENLSLSDRERCPLYGVKTGSDCLLTSSSEAVNIFDPSDDRSLSLHLTSLSGCLTSYGLSPQQRSYLLYLVVNALGCVFAMWRVSIQTHNNICRGVASSWFNRLCSFAIMTGPNRLRREVHCFNLISFAMNLPFSHAYLCIENPITRPGAPIIPMPGSRRNREQSNPIQRLSKLLQLSALYFNSMTKVVTDAHCFSTCSHTEFFHAMRSVSESELEAHGALLHRLDDNAEDTDTDIYYPYRSCERAPWPLPNEFVFAAQLVAPIQSRFMPQTGDAKNASNQSNVPVIDVSESEGLLLIYSHDQAGAENIAISDSMWSVSTDYSSGPPSKGL